jgi:protein gp37
MQRAGKKAAGRELDGQIRDEFPSSPGRGWPWCHGCTI